MNIILPSLRIAAAGFLISFLGTLPFGVLNILAFYIALTESFLDALLFSIGVVITELLYVGLTLYGAGRLRSNAFSGWLIRLLMIAIVLAAACSGLRDALSDKPLEPALPTGIPRFLLGLGLSAVNALQIPFWMGWNAVLIDRNLLVLSKPTVTRYLLGIGSGTLSGLFVFVFTAIALGSRAVIYLREIQLCVSFVLIATAGFMTFRLVVSRQKQTV